MQKLLSLIVAVILVSGRFATADEEPRVVKLQISPAATTRPALQLPLLPEITEQQPGNAAPLYFTAALMTAQSRAVVTADGKFVGPTDDDLLDKTPGTPDLSREQASQLVARYRSSLDLLNLATRREDCDWELPLREQGIATLLPHLQDLRFLGMVLAMKARLQIIDGEFSDAVISLRQGFYLSRNLNEKAVLVNSLVAAGIAQRMLQNIEELIRRENSPNLYWSVAALPRPFIDPREAARWERSILEISVPGLEKTLSGMTSVDEWRRISAKTYPLLSMWDQPKTTDFRAGMARVLTAATVYPQAKEYFFGRGFTHEKIESMPVDYIVGIYQYARYREASDEMWKLFYLPYWQSAEAMQKQEQDFHSSSRLTNPFFVLVPAVSRARLNLALVDRQIAMLQCVEALRDHAAKHSGKLPQALTDITDPPIPLDPLSNQTFVYKAALDGRSAILQAPQFEKPKPVADGLSGIVGPQSQRVIFEISVRPSAAKDKP